MQIRPRIQREGTCISRHNGGSAILRKRFSLHAVPACRNKYIEREAVKLTLFKKKTQFMTALLLILLSITLRQGWGSDESVVEVQPGLFTAGIPTEQFELRAMPKTWGKQRQSNWCWAAVLQMILNYHGVNVTEEMIVKHVFGDVIDTPIAVDDVVSRISNWVGWKMQDSGSPATVLLATTEAGNPVIVYDLAHCKPMIAGLSPLKGEVGHAYVLTAATYTLDPTSKKPVMKSVVLRDPWPESPSRLEMTWDEFSRRCIFLARVRVNEMMFP